MPTDIHSSENQPAGAQQQFQSERGPHGDWSTSGTQVSPMMRPTMQDERFIEIDDVSLAMRQFYQSPVRAAG